MRCVSRHLVYGDDVQPQAVKFFAAIWISIGRSAASEAIYFQEVHALLQGQP
jgi:hypothetical protein